MFLAALILASTLHPGPNLVPQEDEERTPALVHHEPLDSGAKRDVRDLLAKFCGVVPFSSIHRLRGRTSLSTAGDEALAIHEEQAQARVRFGWTLRFLAPHTVSFELFDHFHGIRARAPVIVESVQGPRLGGESSEAIRESLQNVFSEVVMAGRASESSPSTAYVDNPNRTSVEDRLDLGFVWRQTTDGFIVASVYEDALVFENGLRLGDRLVTVGDRALGDGDTPSSRGARWKHGQSFELGIQRAGTALQVTGRMDWTSRILPSWQEAVVGKPFGPREAWGWTRGKILVALVVDIEDAAEYPGWTVLRWLRDHWEKEEVVMVVGLMGGSGESVSSFERGHHRLGLSIFEADPWIDALRVDPGPSLLVVDGTGTLRFRHCGERDVRFAVESLRRE